MRGSGRLPPFNLMQRKAWPRWGLSGNQWSWIFQTIERLNKILKWQNREHHILREISLQTTWPGASWKFVAFLQKGWQVGWIETPVAWWKEPQLRFLLSLLRSSFLVYLDSVTGWTQLERNQRETAVCVEGTVRKTKATLTKGISTTGLLYLKMRFYCFNTRPCLLRTVKERAKEQKNL